MYIAKLKKTDIEKQHLLLKKYIKQLISNDNKDINKQINVIYNNMLKYTQDGSAIILGAFINDILTGFIWAYKISDTISHINYFCVDSDNRNCGIGTLLLKEVEKEIFKEHNEIKEIELLVNKNNIKAIKFYKNNGFLESAIMLDKIKFVKKIGV